MSVRLRNAAMVSMTRTATRVNPPRASVCATTASSGVSILKCDGTPRHACSETRNVSRTHAAAKIPSSRVRVRSSSDTNEAIHVTLMSVTPKERPKVVGFRNDRGPSHEPPLVNRMARWTSPPRMSRAPTV